MKGLIVKIPNTDNGFPETGFLASFNLFKVSFFNKPFLQLRYNLFAVAYKFAFFHVSTPKLELFDATFT